MIPKDGQEEPDISDLLAVHCGRNEHFLGQLLGRQDELYNTLNNYGVRRHEGIEQFLRMSIELAINND